jgi:hypothetical protein
MTGSVCIGEFPVIVGAAFPVIAGLDPVIRSGTVLTKWPDQAW